MSAVNVLAVQRSFETVDHGTEQKCAVGGGDAACIVHDAVRRYGIGRCGQHVVLSGGACDHGGGGSPTRSGSR